MNNYLMTGDRTRWEVLWVVRKKGKQPRIVCIEFENDFSGALQLYLKVKAAGRPLCTLRCTNVGFPPPEKFRPHFIRVVVGHKVVRRKGRKFRKKIYGDQEVIPLKELNLKGVWWCPYCREMRRFQHWDGYESRTLFSGVWIPKPGMYCPMCGISQEDHHVRKWNPQAITIQYQIEAPKRLRKAKTNGRGRSRSRSSRRRT